MRGIWTTDEIRTAERSVMACLPPGALMARAARAIAVEAVAMLGFSYGARVLLLVGPGDNGADALWAGAELARRGVAVQAVLGADRADQPGTAAFTGAGGRIVPLACAVDPDLVIDGLLGIGATPPLRAAMLPLVEFSRRRRVLAVDLPSGVDPNTGAVPGPAVRAERTVTMGGYKVGLMVGPGRVHAGEIRLVDIGLAPALPAPALQVLQPEDVTVSRPGPDSDKYTRGVVGVVAGSAQYPGAALLCTGSARLGGVGAVRFAGRAKNEVVRAHPEVLVTETVAEAGRVQAWVIGPGLGSADDAVRSLREVLAQDVPVIVDADGLNLLAQHRELLAGRRAQTVLTPHDREFERLFGEVGADRVSAARRGAADSGATVLLKGNATVVADPDGRGYVNPTGSPVLATAGSGDVLSGLIGSLLATGVQPALAAARAAYLHGLAAHRAAEEGPVVAPDLIAGLRRVLAEAGGGV
ncbi:MAG TPA: NAD(P)H-hydrate dehydratase [Jatrophihabitans sp.]|nr:NAD(P)H-hydrate dehydratase [Jatrophihabitans sp.]